MDNYRNDPLGEEDLASVAEFLVRASSWIQGSDASPTDREQPPQGALLETLRWRLLENPARRPELGLCLRDTNHTLLGVMLYFPSWFVFEDQRVMGLGSGGFFVDPRARLQGFFMFRKLLKARDVDFFFATTCNEASGPLWEKLGGSPTRGAIETYTLMIRAEAVAEEFAVRRRVRGVPLAAARLAGRLATPLLSLSRGRSKISFHPTDDWDRLANLATLHRRHDALGCERSAEYLRWRYERSPSALRNELFEFRGSAGLAGWFSCQAQPNSGSLKRIRRYTILDIVYPRNGLDPASLVDALASLFSERADLVDLPYTLAKESQIRSPKLWRRQNLFPSSYAMSSRNWARPLPEILDLVPADGDRFE
jgi:hypothetical protein